MLKNKRFTVPLKRKRTSKTNYIKRLGYIKSKKTRLVIRLHTNNIILQFVNYEPKGDRVLITTNSQELKKFNWDYHRGNIPSSYLTGLLCGIKAKQKNIKEAILDLGLHKPTKGSRTYAALKGVLDAGINIPHAKDVLLDKETLAGKKIEHYANFLSKNQESYKKRFSSYIQKNIKPEDIPQKFEEIKTKIIK